MAVSAKRKAPQRFSVPAGNEVTDYCSDKEAVAQRSPELSPLGPAVCLDFRKGESSLFVRPSRDQHQTFDTPG